ncbi:hypothetical protein FQR65_LT13292 [Abscondita terminalis]|nr:hypothetical protein FQR65_LT13292 [Abscondita terminalis]
MLAYNLLYQHMYIIFPKCLFHYLSILWGSAILHLAISVSNIVHFIFFVTFGYILTYYFNSMHIKRRITTEYVALPCITYLFLCEFLHPYTEDWVQARGVFMISAMKLMSLCFDLQHGHEIPSVSAYLGYIFCPGNVLFGPWIPYNEYASGVLQCRRRGFNYIVKLLWVFILSFFFLIISNCWNVLVLPSEIDNRWILAYRRALSFRCSHYFISFLSEATMLCAGYSDDKHQESTWGYTITRPSDTEFPSSLVNVVIGWNIPMHKFLKKYVYLELLKFGYFKAIFGTYFVSSLLHGFNLEIATVLLTISLYSYVQLRLQEKLTTKFNACLRVRPCKECNHKFKRSNILVKLAHLFFAFVTVFDLIYLGVLMDSVGAEESPSIYEKWKELGFLSHWLMLGLYIITLLG